MLNAKLYKIKDDKLNIWKEWGQRIITEFKDEALATLKDEGFTHEGFFIFNIQNSYYTLGFGISDSEPRKPDIHNKLNAEHNRIKKECLEPVDNFSLSISYFLEAGN